MHKHYIRLNNKNHIIKGFSTAFEQPEENDILIVETKERHYNPAISRDDGLPKYKYINDTWVENTDTDLTEELEAMVEPDYQAEFELDVLACNTIEDIKNVLIGIGKKSKVKATKK